MLFHPPPNSLRLRIIGLPYIPYVFHTRFYPKYNPCVQDGFHIDFLQLLKAGKRKGDTRKRV